MGTHVICLFIGIYNWEYIFYHRFIFPIHIIEVLYVYKSINIDSIGIFPMEFVLSIGIFLMEIVLNIYKLLGGNWLS